MRDQGLETNGKPTAKLPPKIEFFRFRDSKKYRSEAGLKSSGAPDGDAKTGLSLLVRSGFYEGMRSTVLFDAGGFSLAHLWIKQGFRLPPHVHNVDCLYCVIGGSLLVGNEHLAVGDGFWVPAGVAYAISAKELGAEILEFRHSALCDVSTRFLARSANYWKSVARSISESRERWAVETPPTIPASYIAD
jgi:hypothetical protein